jgi:nucleoside-diphosphate-sugar epimerase
LNYLLGGTGVLGKAFLSKLAVDNVKIVSRKDYLSWTSFDKTQKYFKQNKINSFDSIFICSGVTNPQSSKEVLNAINFQIPRNILLVAQAIGTKVITFGSVHENFEPTNPYMESKRKLFESINTNQDYANHKHLQLHTIYGINYPKKHMLLGVIENSIKFKTILKMTSGLQLREYWHAEDIANLAFNHKLVNSFERIEKISCGQPFQIRDLALAVFGHFDLLDILVIGGIEDPPNENYNNLMAPRILDLARFRRDEFSGVIEYLEECLSGSIER